MTKPTGEFIYEAYNPKRELVPIDSIERSAMHVHCQRHQIWFIDNKFGVSLRLSQALFEQSTKLPSFAFQGIGGPSDRLTKKMKLNTTKKMKLTNKIYNYINASRPAY